MSRIPLITLSFVLTTVPSPVVNKLKSILGTDFLLDCESGVLLVESINMIVENR